MGLGEQIGGWINGRIAAAWPHTPPSFRRRVIQRKAAKYDDQLSKGCKIGNQQIRDFDNRLSAFAPSYGSRAPVVDYKRQFARGTLVEGRDAYLPTAVAQQRLLNLWEPYTEEEQKERERYSRYNVKFAAGCLVAGFLIHDYKQSRPIAWCAHMEPSPPRYPFYVRKIGHSHDVRSVRRGWEVFRQVCSTCHSIRKSKWWFLMKDVYPVRRVQEFAAERTMVDGQKDDGDINLRPCGTFDTFPPPFPNEEAAKEANNGKVPPDFSQGPSFYTGGADYFFSVLTGYRDPPVGVKVPDGLYYNTWFHGGIIAMSPPLSPGLVEYEDGTPATIPQMAKDAVNFLSFQSDPTHDQRTLEGIKAVTACSIATVFFVLSRRFHWAGLWLRRVDFGKIRSL